MIKLIVGLNNPGNEYAQTRHNAGAWFCEHLACKLGVSFKSEKKFFADCARVQIKGKDIVIALPTTFMNRSGQSVQALMQFYKIKPQEVLVAHDELDLSVGVSRLKSGGGHGGHNGLRDISQRIGSDYLRLRIGIGHPGASPLVTGYVLSKPSLSDRLLIDSGIEKALAVIEEVVDGQLAHAMNVLHSN